MTDPEKSGCPMNALVLEVTGRDGTERFARILASAVVPGAVIGLTGTLGAGKTFLIQSLAEGLGIDRSTVVSPTFALIQSYSEGRIPLVHIDAWRIRDRDEYQELGIDEIMESGPIVVMEWAERFSSLLPDDRLSITIAITGEESRQFEISWPPEAPVAREIGRRLQGLLTGTGSNTATFGKQGLSSADDGSGIRAN